MKDNKRSPGQTGNTPGQSGQTPGQSGNNPGHGGQIPGQTGNTPGQSGQTPGQSGMHDMPSWQREGQPHGKAQDKETVRKQQPGQAHKPNAG
jgi:hypothetical protein